MYKTLRTEKSFFIQHLSHKPGQHDNNFDGNKKNIYDYHDDDNHNNNCKCHQIRLN